MYSNLLLIGCFDLTFQILHFGLGSPHSRFLVLYARHPFFQQLGNASDRCLLAILISIYWIQFSNWKTCWCFQRQNLQYLTLAWRGHRLGALWLCPQCWPKALVVLWRGGAWWPHSLQYSESNHDLTRLGSRAYPTDCRWPKRRRKRQKLTQRGCTDIIWREIRWRKVDNLGTYVQFTAPRSGSFPKSSSEIADKTPKLAVFQTNKVLERE